MHLAPSYYGEDCLTATGRGGSYVFLMPKNSIRGLKMSLPDNFRYIACEISAGKIFLAPKDSYLNFKGSLLSYFWAIVLISAVMSIFGDFGSLLPARPVAVKNKCSKWKLVFDTNNIQILRSKV